MQTLLTLYRKHREVIAYLFFGGLCTLLNIVLYALFSVLFGNTAANSWANVLDTVLCILFAYVTNRTWVFESRTHGREARDEFVRFFSCRLGTLVIDAVIMFVGGNVIGPAVVAESLLKLWGTGCKIVSNVVVVVCNYVLSKWVIFKKK